MHLVDAAGCTLEPSWHAMIAAGGPASRPLLRPAARHRHGDVVLDRDAPPSSPRPSGRFRKACRPTGGCRCAPPSTPRSPISPSRARCIASTAPTRAWAARGPSSARPFRRRLRTQRWFLRRLEAGHASPAELVEAWAAFERNATEAIRLGGSAFGATVEVDDDDRESARLLLAEARELERRGAHARALAAFARAAPATPGTTTPAPP